MTGCGIRRHIGLALLAFSYSASLSAQSYHFITLAGRSKATGAPDGAGAADGVGSVAEFSFPWGLAVGSSGNVFVADNNNDTIRMIASSGTVTTVAGKAGVEGSANGIGSAAHFFLPAGVAIDGSENVYVADDFNDMIRKVTPAGVVTTLAGGARSASSGATFADGIGSAAHFFLPAGVAVDNGYNVYVADDFNDTIRKVTPAGVVTTLAGIANNPGYADGPTGTSLFNRPESIAVDGNGNLYVADTGNQVIRKISPGGKVTTLAGRPGVRGSADGNVNLAEFNDPGGIAVDRTGKVFVADSGNDTIRMITPAGVVATLAGTPSVGGNADGTGGAAAFRGPLGIAVDGNGNLYVADSGNNSVRKGLPDSRGAVLGGAN